MKTIDSREVAEMTDKRHSDLIRDIRGYIETIDNSTNANLRSLEFFIESTYFDSKNEERPCYLITKKGCDMVANKMTGEKGILFTATYVSRFEEMEKSQSLDTTKLSPQLQMFSQLFQTIAQQELETRELKIAVLEAKKGFEQTKESLNNIKETIIQTPDNWRENINKQLNKIVQSTTELNYQEVRVKSYKMLEERGHCNLSARVRNLKQRLTDAGEKKTKINTVSKLDVIEADSKLKEIYSSIVKELVIKFVS
jgi:Rha family phage regulatory protein